MTWREEDDGGEGWVLRKGRRRNVKLEEGKRRKTQVR